VLWRGCRDEDDSYGCWTVLGFQRGVGGCTVTVCGGAAVTLHASLRGNEITFMTTSVDIGPFLMSAVGRAISKSRKDGHAVCYGELGVYISRSTVSK